MKDLLVSVRAPELVQRSVRKVMGLWRTDLEVTTEAGTARMYPCSYLLQTLRCSIELEALKVFVNMEESTRLLARKGIGEIGPS